MHGGTNTITPLYIPFISLLSFPFLSPSHSFCSALSALSWCFSDHWATAFLCPIAVLFLASLQCFSFLCLITVTQFLAVILVYRLCNYCIYTTIKFGVFPFPLKVSALQSSVQLSLSFHTTLHMVATLATWYIGVVLLLPAFGNS